MSYNGKLVIDVDYDDPIILNVTINDSDGLLTGYTAYCVFDGMVRREINNGTVEVPIGVLIGDKLRIQLLFTKDHFKYYSLNILTALLNRVIRRK